MIPFLDLRQINSPYIQELEEASLQVVRSGWYLLGESLTSFENAFSAYCEAEYCVGVANGLDAISLILKAFDFPPESEVILAANTYIATLLPVTALGLTPVLAEPDPATMLLNPELLENHITGKTRAIITTDLYGRSCEMAPILSIAEKHGIKVITDAAQAHGARYRGRRAGSMAHATAFSFYPTKNLGALGDAGAVVTSDRAVAERIRYLRNYGSLVRYQNEYQGVNSRLDEIQAAFLNIKLPYLDRDNARRKSIARRYLEEISLEEARLPPSDRIDDDVWHLFVIQYPYRDRLKQYLAEKGIQADIHYPTPIHRQNAYPNLSHLQLPVTEKLSREVLSLPLHPALTDDEVSRIIRVINLYKTAIGSQQSETSPGGRAANNLSHE
ncbi:MAG: aminotransferase [Cytophagaceae bacterium SCN 52-12]|nr:MAG: aminotransferase [Cytophagaceae bacterium SCN 52-12]